MAAGTARRVARSVYLVLIVLFLAGVLAQAVLAGRFMFAGASPDPHIGLGWPLAHLLAPVALLLSFFLKGGRAFWVTSLAWGILAIVQPILAALAKDGPNEAAGFHVVNALVLFALTLWLANRAWSLAREKREAAVRSILVRPAPPARPMPPPPPTPPQGRRP